MDDYGYRELGISGYGAHPVRLDHRVGGAGGGFDVNDLFDASKTRFGVESGDVIKGRFDVIDVAQDGMRHSGLQPWVPKVGPPQVPKMHMGVDQPHGSPL